MISEAEFRETIVEMIRRAETTLPADVLRFLKSCLKREKNRIAKLQLKLALKNLELAKKMGVPMCQDTGSFTFFIKSDKKFDFDPKRAINQAVERATHEVPLRANVVDPLTRKLSQTNIGLFQPAVHLELADRPEFEINLLVKGGGTENYSRLYTFTPTLGPGALRRALLSTLSEAGGKICPPVVVGLGVGGNAEVATLLAKKALLRPLDEKNPDRELAQIERKLEDAANALGIGPMGLGGETTVLRVFIERAACHSATLPVAVAFQCWPARRAKAKLVSGRLRVVEP